MLTPKFDTCFFERYAMVSLATLLGEPYAHLVNRDRPDLQDEEGGIGIEVTRAIRENKSVANALVNEMAGEVVKEVNADDLRHIKQTGYAYGLGRPSKTAFTLVFLSRKSRPCSTATSLRDNTRNTRSAVHKGVISMTKQ